MKKSGVSWLNLHRHIKQRDVRKIIYRKLTTYDLFIVKIAHNKAREKHNAATTAEHDYLVYHYARNGYINLLQWLHNTCPGYGMREYAHIIAIECKQVETFMWLAKTWPLGDYSRCCESAAKLGQLENFRYIMSTGHELSDFVHAFAAEKGHLHILQWLNENKYCLNPPLISEGAAAGGHINIIEWLRTIDCVWYASLLFGAVYHIHVLEWLKSNKLSFLKDVCNTAASNGQLDALKWGIDNGYPFDRQQCFNLSTRHKNIQDWLKKWKE